VKSLSDQLFQLSVISLTRYQNGSLSVLRHVWYSGCFYFGIQYNELAFSTTN